MQACILHHHTQDVKPLIDGLTTRNISTKQCVWEDDIVYDALTLWDCNVLIVLVSGSIMPMSLKEIRKIHAHLPIVVLDTVVRKNLDLKEWCITNGADRYISAQSSIHDIDFIIRKTVLEKESLEKPSVIRAFDVCIDIMRHMVERNKKPIPLRNKEFLLLEYFIINQGKVLTRDMILENIWDRNGSYTSNTVDVHVNRLRRKIDAPFKEKLIHTIHCIGYIFDKREIEKQTW